MSEPKIKLDVDVDGETSGRSICVPYINMLKNHQNVRLEFPTIHDAVKLQKAMCEYLSRNSIYNVRQTRRKNIIYLVKEERGT